MPASQPSKRGVRSDQNEAANDRACASADATVELKSSGYRTIPILLMTNE